MSLPEAVETRIQGTVDRHDGAISDVTERLDAAHTSAKEIVDGIESPATMEAVIESNDQVDIIGKDDADQGVMYRAGMETIRMELADRLKESETCEANHDGLADDEFGHLVDVGASVVFLAVVTTPSRSIDGVDRSLAHEEVQRQFNDAEEGDLPDISISGGFLSRLWRGNLFLAYRKADHGNRTVLEHVFTTEQIIADGAVNTDESLDHVRNVVTDQ